MPAHLPHGGVLALVAAGQLGMFQHHCHPLTQRRVGQQGAVPEIGLDLPEHPGASQSRTAHHHQITAALLIEGCGAQGIGDIAVAHHRHRDCLLHLADNIPVRRRLVHLLPGAPMDGQRRGTGLLTDFRELHRIDMVLVPALAELHCHRTVHGFHHRPDDLSCQLRTLHQGTAAAASGNLRGRTTHIDVDPVGVPGQGFLCRCRHQLGIVPEELYRSGTLRLPQTEQLLTLAVAVYQALGAGHLPDGTGRAILPADLPECPVAHPCHRRQNRGPGQCDVPDLQIPVSPLPWTG